MTPRRPLVLVLVAALALAGCPSFAIVEGNGKIREEVRGVGDFNEVEVTAGMSAVVTIGAKKNEVTVRADENLLSVIKIDVVENRLIFGIDANGITPTEPVVVQVQAEQLYFAGAAGGGSITVNGLASAERLRLQGVFGSHVAATGTAPGLKLFLSEASTASLDTLGVASADVDLRDASTASITATDAVRGTLRGGSQLVVAGQPPTREVELLGDSQITWE